MHPSPPPPRTNPFAVVTLVTGIIAPCGAFIVPVVFGIISLVQMRRTGEKGRGMAIGGLAAAALWVIVLIGVVIFAVSTQPARDEAGAITERGTIGVDSLRVGDCVDDLDEEDVAITVTVVPCGTPHDAEVVADFVLPAGPFPGQDEVFRQAEEGCGERLPEKALKGPLAERLQIFTFAPRRESWGEDRKVSCLLVDDSGTKLTEPLSE